MDISSIIFSGSYFAIFLLMILNGVFNFPSSQVLYVIAGYFVSTGNLLFLPTIIAGAIGNTIGNIIIFLLIKKYKHSLARKLLMMDENNFQKIHNALHTTFMNKGMWWIFLGKITPSVKAFVPIVAGLSSTPKYLTAFIFLVSSTLWAIMITAIGFYFGQKFSASAFTGISLIIGLVIIFFIYKKVSKSINQDLVN